MTPFCLPCSKEFKNKGKTEAMELLGKSVANIQALQALYSELFHYSKLSDASTDFKASATSSRNEVVSKAVEATLDQVEAVAQMARSLEYFIILHIPKIEDGGNFGVGKFSIVWRFL
jgi:hypothetical protein